MTTKGQRDILDDLFRGEQPFTTVPGLEELDSLIHACVAPSEEKRRSGEKKLLSLQNKRLSGTKKATHYLQEEVFDGLTEANLILKGMLPDGAKSRASKSRLVNYAVTKLLKEIEEKGDDSPLVKSILSDEE
ncbi:MAG: hypothetical protein EOL86_00110 [Deltaproteobacteria bacterium]|nr:hypothetical protein [Deltaproteobacteria bacterium]